MLEIGLVGKPSSGKSSTFKAATLMDVKITGVPFCTIKPNRGTAYVIVDCVCKEFNVKCNPKYGMCKNGKRFVPVVLWDVAGLVPGAHEGRGLGNQFLDDLRQASVLMHVVDFSGLRDAEGKQTEGYNPELDIEFLEKEIDLWFADVLKRAMEKYGKKVSGPSGADLAQTLSQQLSGLEVSKKHIEQALEKASTSDIENFAKVLRRIAKPIMIAANKIDLKEAQENFEKLKEKYPNIVPTSAEAEIALKKADEKGLVEYFPMDGFEIKGNIGEEQKRALDFIKREVIEKYGTTGVQKCLNKSVFDLLDYIAVYPVEDESKVTDSKGNVLPDVHLLPKGSTALDLAFKIHTDIGEKFICAVDARTKKRLGKEYVLKNNDVIRIMIAK
ncbi:MAG TPA: redox-regulated ATPase YchF [archaeon]|nr:redox-regulated ATPase YchF [archaeon]